MEISDHTIKTLYDTWDIPKGMKGAPSEFRKIFNSNFLSKHGLIEQQVLYKIPFLRNGYVQQVVNTKNGRMLVADGVSPQDEIIYLGNGLWELVKNEEKIEKKELKKDN